MTNWSEIITGFFVGTVSSLLGWGLRFEIEAFARRKDRQKELAMQQEQVELLRDIKQGLTKGYYDL